MICHLPCGNESETKAFYAVVDYLKSQRRASVPVTGYTFSTIRPSAFLGYWFGKSPNQESKPQRWVGDNIVMLMIDYKIELRDRRLSLMVKEIKKAVVKAYKKHDCTQTEFWITAQQIFRYAD